MNMDKLILHKMPYEAFNMVFIMGESSNGKKCNHDTGNKREGRF